MNSKGTHISHAGIYWLASLLVLTQLPHVLHLPLWVSLTGIGLIVGKALYRNAFARFFPPWVLAMLAFLAAVAVKFQFGYFLGRDPSVAFLFILVALKFAETKQRRDITLLICLSGFLLFTQYFYSQTILAALVSLPAVFAMGGSLYVLRDHSHNLGVKPVVKLIGKLLLQGVPLATLLFFVFPRLSSPLWSLPNDAVSTTGLSNSMAPGSISDLSLSSAVAFRVDFEGDTPDKKDLYWRGPVLSQYDGREWSLANKAYPVVPTTTGAEIHYTVTLEAHNNDWLFALDNPSALPFDASHALQNAEPIASLNNLGQLISNNPVRESVRYKQSSTLQNTLQDFKPDLISNLQIADNNSRSLRFARELRKKYSDDAQLASSILSWFNQQPFYYTLKPSLLGHDPVDEFLFDTREGFCEHYASSFVYLLRASGIPARVVTGYQGGEMNDDYLIVRQSDAHAWAEVWIDRKWQRYDPTAAVAPSRVTMGVASALGDDEPVPLLARLDGGWLKSIQLNFDSLNHRWRKHVINFGFDDQLEIFKSIGFSNVQPWQIMAFAVAIAFIWAGFILNVRAPSLKRGNEADKLWQKFQDHLNKAGLGVDRTIGPQSLGKLAGKNWPQESDHIDKVVELFIQLQYSREGQEPLLRKDLLKKIKRQIRLLPHLPELNSK